jgi:hypothetical protein
VVVVIDPPIAGIFLLTIVFGVVVFVISAGCFIRRGWREEAASPLRLSKRWRLQSLSTAMFVCMLLLTAFEMGVAFTGTVVKTGGSYEW